MQYDEVNQDYALALYIGAIGDSLFQEVDTYAANDGDHVGWSMLVDIDRCPDKALPWFAQFVGQQLPGGLTPAQQRAYIKSLISWKRGTPESMKLAVSQYLTGNKTILFRERFAGDAWRLEVVTYNNETPAGNIPLIQKALLEQKPAGIQLLFITRTGQDFQSVYVNNATFQVVYTKYKDFSALLLDQPGA